MGLIEAIAGASPRVINGPVDERPLSFSGDGTALFVVHRAAETLEIERIDLATGARRAELGANAVSAAAAVGDGSSRLLLVLHEVSQPGPARYRAWDVSTPKSPVLLFSGEAERRAEVLADKRGEIVVIAGYQAITVLDAGNGMPLSTIALSSVRRNVALSNAGGVRMLAVSHELARSARASGANRASPRLSARRAGPSQGSTGTR